MGAFHLTNPGVSYDIVGRILLSIFTFTSGGKAHQWALAALTDEMIEFQVPCPIFSGFLFIRYVLDLYLLTIQNNPR